MAFTLDPILFALLVVILLVIVAFYLLLRRTATAFREGNERGRR